MTAPTGTTIAPKQGKDTTCSSAGGKATAKIYPNGIPKVSNNNLGRHPRKVKKTTLPSLIMIFSESDGVPSDEHEGTSVKIIGEEARTRREDVQEILGQEAGDEAGSEGEEGKEEEVPPGPSIASCSTTGMTSSSQPVL
jgi:hypothetical protein